MITINKYKLNPATAWGEIHGDINQQVDLKNLLATEISGVETWVNSQGFAKESDIPELPDLSDYALKTELPDLSDYTTSFKQNQCEALYIINSAGIAYHQHAVLHLIKPQEGLCTAMP